MAIDAVSAKVNLRKRNKFIQQNRAFILNCASSVCHRQITDSEDEWSIALSAFNEAIDSFYPEQGDFYSLAGTIIKRRLIDEFRRQSRYQNEIMVEPQVFDGNIDEEDAGALQLETAGKSSELTVTEAEEAENISSAAAEIADMQDVLRAYGFSFYDLASCSPKAEKTRRLCAHAIRHLLENPDLMASMHRTHSLPASQIMKLEKIPPKILERHRRYIIASAEILTGDYPILSSYLREIRREMYR